MNAKFQLNLLNQLSNKKANKGFTLIELLVVVIIIGVLAAIALPNLLGQVGKARESEAKSQVGAVNRAQQAYYTEYTTFANDAASLEVPLEKGKYYDYTMPALGVILADDAANSKNGTRDFLGGVSYNTGTRAFSTVVCRGDKDATLAASNVKDYGEQATNNVDCGNNTTAVK